MVGSSAIRANITLIRALHFPRACLPLSYVLVEFQQLLLAISQLVPFFLRVWAVVALVLGVLYFWQAETRYGRG